MAAGIGNLHRLPQVTFIRGGLPFYIAYLVLTVVIGLPLLFLELGIGQLAQEGFIKSWRAVPFFRGIGYIKLVAGCLLSIYYPLYMGIALYYIIWILKEPFPFQECSAGVKITDSGYSVQGKNGQQCLRETFLKSPFVDPYWYAIYTGLMFLTWTVILIWTALGYILINIILGSGSIIISQIMTGKVKATPAEGDIAELHLITLIYDTARSSTKDDIKCWIILAYLLVILAGFINMATIMHTILKAISTLNINRLNWWQTSLISTFVAYILGCVILLQTDFDIVHLLDHYIVGNLIVIIVIIEVFALITFYGTERIKSDFEFMLGHILSKIWLLLWWLLPVLLTAIFTWGMVTLPLEGIYKADPVWLYGIGWGVLLTAFIFIFLIGFYIVFKQDGYTFSDGVTLVTWKAKIKASLKPSNNWGPKDPMSRHTWIQWNSKAKQGERDFTLKRQGTRDYTRSIKKSSKKAASDLTPAMPGIYLKNGNHQNIMTDSYSDLYGSHEESVSSLDRTAEHKNRENPLRITSLVDSFDHDFSHKSNSSYPLDEYMTNLNPLARTNFYGEYEENSVPEGYGTFRRGPYIINDGNIGHVCYRRYSESEDATEL
ncbi:hypothetical protein NQ317_014754 [Molorchus minor]|uniref:Uncharacterized protein n=1 Tax=Molorchus minor TaxID=1323400 RepID=A0ABQ9J1N5_9CUCU|nr:hypothetical protein NQ317_014754 [Molorchus minor]